MKATGVGIKGIGVFLPPIVRKNDFWPEHIVAGFHGRKADDLGETPLGVTADLEPSGDANSIARVIREEMARWKDDPFHGAVERRVAPDGMKASDMEFSAAKAAIRDADLQPGDIGLLLVHSFITDRANSTNQALLHHRLGLPQECVGIETDKTCGGLLLQMLLAAPFLKNGGGKYALLVQSTLFSRILDPTSPISTTFGDAASAVVLGPVSDHRGILSIQSFMNGRFHDIAVLASDSPEPWYLACGGRLKHMALDTDALADLPEFGVKCAQTSIGSVLHEAGIGTRDVDLFASHQPTSSFNAICRRVSGLADTKTVDTFSTLGAMSACVIPVNLSRARDQGLLHDDANVVLFSTGAGVNWSAAVLRWGA